MKKTALLLLVLLLSLPLCAGDKGGSKIAYGTYINARYQYEVKYPKELLFPSAPPDNNDGRSFDSKDKKAYISVCGKHLVAWSWEEEYQWWLDEYKDAKITYKVFNKKFFVVSGYVKDKVFYEKEVLLGTEDDPIVLEFGMQYPKKDKVFWDPIAATCSASLRMTEQPVTSGHSISGIGKNEDQFLGQ